ncbi:TPA: hypothetical protein P2Q89_004176 [Aeromonas veronii]|nr:hypothetical protein [Aeromonas veronii]
MNIEQRLAWATRPEGIACFVEGMFVRSCFYKEHQGQLAWYCQQVKPIKVCSRAVKKLAGQQIYYGGVPKGLFDAWLAQQPEGQWTITHHPWGVWLALPTPLDIPALLAWCSAHAAPPSSKSNSKSSSKPPKSAPASTTPAGQADEAINDARSQVLQQLRALPLADITPLQALQWLHQWQRQLQPAATPSLLSPAPLERDAAMAD